MAGRRPFAKVIHREVVVQCARCDSSELTLHQMVEKQAAVVGLDDGAPVLDQDTIREAVQQEYLYCTTCGTKQHLPFLS